MISHRIEPGQTRALPIRTDTAPIHNLGVVATSLHGTMYALSSVRLKGRKPLHCRRSASRVGSRCMAPDLSQCPHWRPRPLTEQVQRTAALRPKCRVLHSDLMAGMGSKWAFAARRMDVGSWHSAAIGAGRTECQKGLEAEVRCGIHQCRHLAQSTRSVAHGPRPDIHRIADISAAMSGQRARPTLWINLIRLSASH
jgi:hypothetical protein